MKIAILIQEFESLPNWQLRIISEIINNQCLELTLLIKDGRKAEKGSNSFKVRLLKLLKSKNILGKVFFKLQKSLENKIFPERYSVDKKTLIGQLNQVEVIELFPERKGFLDIFSIEDSDKVKRYELDIILRHEFNIIRGALLTASKYGIWSFHHGDNLINRGGPAGFWEIVLKQESVGVTLQQLTSEIDGGLVIDKAYFNRHWSFVKTNRRILEGSVSVLFKNLKRLGQVDYLPQKSMVYYNPLYRAPDFKVALLYSLGFFKKLFGTILERLNTILFGTRYKCWTLFIGKGDFLDSSLFRLEPVKLPKNEFWADPFILNHKEENYVFFENYSYKTKKGKISCGKVKGNKLVDVSDVLNLNYHLSFPYVFKKGDDIFLMPETKENKRLEIYKCLDFPNDWELYSTAFEGQEVADANFYIDDDGQSWLFINKKADKETSMHSELFIYKVDSLKLENMIPHSLNPVIINSKIARNGGEIFKYEGKIYRPSQANIDGIYGRALNINEIKLLTLDEYLEKSIVTIYPNFMKGLVSMHHLHQSSGIFVIDAAYRKKR